MREVLLHTGSLPLELEQRVDQLCDELEDALKWGIVPDADRYLARLHHSAHRQFLHEMTKLVRAYAASEAAPANGTESVVSADLPAARADLPNTPRPRDVGDTTRAYLRRSLEFLEQIDDAGMRFEQALIRGQLLRIEDMIPPAEAATRPSLLRELLKLEMGFRAKRGENPSLREYRARFPEDARLVKHVYLENFTPGQIGEFSVQRLLGRGGFGHVYQGWDPKLSRNVAIKVFRRELEAAAGGLLSEAQTAAQLHHPGIVAVYAIQSDEDGDEFLVLEYVDGNSLEEELRSRNLSPRDAAALMLAVVQALQHSHEQELIHCDLKPANILLDEGRRPRVTDFGVALHVKNAWRSVDVAGTLPYMAPEQAAGETHRLDARTDLWAVGVILYRALTGWLPFAGASQQELLDAIRHREPKSLLVHNPAIPVELARVVMRCLAKQMSERYQSAGELAEDLRVFLTPAQQREPNELALGDSHPEPVVPKGLRAFDENDRDFFLQLVPGPRDRRGVPEAVCFWETRLCETESERTFRVGLLYGPSGSGKSSLMRAGVLPRLHGRVRVVVIESSRDGTEHRLAKELCRRFAGIAPERPLAEALGTLREGPLLAAGEKLLIVLDQFEQWLHGARHDEAATLVDAMRQCDGGRVQALVLVRDDFWTPATRFFKRLDIALVEGHNTRGVDLFNEAHAAAVLGAFGAAHGRVAADPDNRAAEELRFIEQAVSELSDDGWIVPIRLCILAELVKSRAWTPATLRDLGGATGLGTIFLEEVFDSPGALPQHRLLRSAARAALEQLLPPLGSDIRGHSVSESQLREVLGYEHDPQAFAALLQCLDQELRLVTPSEPESAATSNSEAQGDPTSERRYQLTHDFLVSAVRGWLDQVRRRTITGRAQLRLKEYAALCTIRPEARHLPSWWEWFGLLLLTRPRQWKGPERAMMRAATRYHALRSGVILAVAFVLSAVTYDRFSATRAEGLVRALASSDSRDVREIVERLRDYRRWARPRIAELLAGCGEPSDERTRLLLGLQAMGERQGDELRARLLDSEPPLTLAIADLMQCTGALAGSESYLRAVALDAAAPRGRRLRACVALARLESAHNADAWEALATDAASLLRADLVQYPRHFDAWVGGMSPIRQWLIKPLGDAFSDSAIPMAERAMVAEILGRYSADDPAQLVEFALRSTPQQLVPISCAFAAHIPVVRAALEREAVVTAPGDSSDDEKDRRTARQANAIVLLNDFGNDKYLWPALQHRPDPRLRTFLLRHFRETLPSTDWLRHLAGQSDPGIRQALVLALGFSGGSEDMAERRTGLADELAQIYREDPDSGVHSACDWSLRHVGGQAVLDGALTDLAQRGIRSGYHWYVTKSRITMIIIDSPGVVTLGSPTSEVGRDTKDEAQWTRTIDWKYAISATEITQAQYFEVCPDYTEHKNEYAPEDRCPANVVSAIDAEEFCRRLSLRDGLESPEGGMNGEREGSKRSLGGLLASAAYRLPTEAEWEVACRAGTATSRCFGSAVEFLPYYACYSGNSGARTWPVGHAWPNAWGLFDMLGNVAEWCQDAYLTNPASGPEGRIPRPALRSLTYLVVRGSDFNSLPRIVRTANRRSIQAKDKNYAQGFRIAQTLRTADSHD